MILSLRPAEEPAGPEWPVGPDRVALAEGEVHVWAARLDLPAPHLEYLLPLLAPEEAGRAARFVFARDRDRFVAARGILRMVLGRYLDLPPADIRFEYSLHGKPYVQHPPTISFNLSHSAGLVLIAVGRYTQIGVDLEQLRSDLDADTIVDQFFAPSEKRSYLALSTQERSVAFLRAWTRKEAYIKARGEGLSMPLDQFAVTLAPGERPELIDHALDPAEVGRWSLYDLDPGPGLAAALAVEGQGCTVTCLRWPQLAASLQIDGITFEATPPRPSQSGSSSA